MTQQLTGHNVLYQLLRLFITFAIKKHTYIQKRALIIICEAKIPSIQRYITVFVLVSYTLIMFQDCTFSYILNYHDTHSELNINMCYLNVDNAQRVSTAHYLQFYSGSVTLACNMYGLIRRGVWDIRDLIDIRALYLKLVVRVHTIVIDQVQHCQTSIISESVLIYRDIKTEWTSLLINGCTMLHLVSDCRAQAEVLPYIIFKVIFREYQIYRLADYYAFFTGYSNWLHGRYLRETFLCFFIRAFSRSWFSHDSPSLRGAYSFYYFIFGFYYGIYG